MTIARQFLRLMNSELKIQSEYEKGSEFSFDLEQKIVDTAPLGDFRGKLLKTENKKKRLDFTAPKAKILVVDDNKMNLKVFKGILTQINLQITEALSGRECLELLKNQSYDLIFLDHMMPELDGIETFHLIQAQKLCEDTPIVMLTANALVGDKEMYLKEGFTDFLSKPIVPEKLDAMLVKYLPQHLVQTSSEEAAVEIKKLQSEWKKNKKMSEISPAELLKGLKQELPELDLESGLAMCGEEENLYAELLDEFVHLKIKRELEKAYENRDYKDYCVRIHSFKNNAYSIGAKKMGDLAFELEKRTRVELPEEIIILQRNLLEQYDRICVKYGEIIKTCQM